MYEIISKEEFAEIMEGLQGKEVWLKISTDTVDVNVVYPEFEFLIFCNGKYQFGTQDYDEESNIQSIQIRENEIKEIHRDKFAPTLNDEQIILIMIDGTEIFIEN